MSSFIEKTLVLDRIKEAYSLKSNAKLAAFLGIPPTTLSSWYSRKTFDLDVIYEKCVGINWEWLFTGTGSMFKKTENSNTENFLNEKEELYNVKPECEYNATTPAKSAVLDRIALFVENSQLSKKAFADAINMEQSTVNNQLIGKRGLSIDLILSFLSSYSNISAEWLLRGRGDMYICNNKSEDTQYLRNRIAYLEGENKVLRELGGLVQHNDTKEKSA